MRVRRGCFAEFILGAAEGLVTTLGRSESPWTMELTAEKENPRRFPTLGKDEGFATDLLRIRGHFRCDQFPAEVEGYSFQKRSSTNFQPWGTTCSLTSAIMPG